MTSREHWAGIVAANAAALRGRRVAGVVAGALVCSHAGALARTITICPATGDPRAPWRSLTFDQSDFNQHARQGDFLRVECCADSECPNQ